MFLKWFPWRYLVREAARQRGYLDPIKILSQTQNFMQPSQVVAPTELLRLAVILHARGLMNSLAIQHNLDWVWPYWAQCQYDPRHKAFIPRAFSLTQINLTNRNWTAIGIPGCDKLPIVDPRGLLTPHYDGWSIDAWIVPFNGRPLVPSRMGAVEQFLMQDGGLKISTTAYGDGMELRSCAHVVGGAGTPVCRLEIYATSMAEGWLVISLRPYNPEGVSFIHDIALLRGGEGWEVNHKQHVYLDTPADHCAFAYYRQGDVFNRLCEQDGSHDVFCKVGMATAAAMFCIKKDMPRQIVVDVPLTDAPYARQRKHEHIHAALEAWGDALAGACSLNVPDEKVKYLYDAALRTLILHSPHDVYPGPFIYKRFWFRDAAFMLNALLCAGLKNRAARVLETYPDRQKNDGYFLSQEGEWDSNGTALWTLQRYCVLSGTTPPDAWRGMIERAGRWIHEKRTAKYSGHKHAGLLPSGFSAEHFGPNDFYYWDDWWGAAGLKAAAWLLNGYGDHETASHFEEEAGSLLRCVEESLKEQAKELKRLAMPSSPYRRLDTSAIGSLAASYPLRLWPTDDPRVLDTANYLMENCLIDGGFFHDMSHSGINPYLTLHLAQVLLRANDRRFEGLMSAVAGLASATGQWPEAVHPTTKGGCMGDGQHAWAAAEWLMMVRNCFVREEGGRLLLCSGIPQSWFDAQKSMSFGPTLTEFGPVSVRVTFEHGKPDVTWQGQWYRQPPIIEAGNENFRLCGHIGPA